MTRLPLFRRCVAPLACLFSLTLAARAQVTPPSAPPPLPPHAFAPIQVTSDGVTVRILDAQWVWPDSVRTPQMFDLNYHFSKNMYLAVWYDVSPASALIAQDSRHSTIYPGAALQTPDGALEGIGDMDPTRGPAARNVFWGEVDPHPDGFTLHFDIPRPDPPPGYRGDVSQDAAFPDLLLPAGPEASVAIGRTLTTPNGTRITIDQIGHGKRLIFSHQRGVPAAWEQDLTIEGHWEPPPAHPDLVADIAMPDWAVYRPGVTPSGVVDDQGENLELDRRLDRFNTISGGRNGRFTVSAHAPAAGAKTVTVRLQLRENAPSLRVAAAYRRFTVTLPNRVIGLPPLRPVPGPQNPVATQSLGDGTVSIERITDNAKTGGDYHLWLRLSTPWPQTPDRQWLSTQEQWKDITNNTISGGAGLREGLFWTAEGRPLPPGDKRYDFGIRSESRPGVITPPQVQMQLDWAEIVRRTTPLPFAAIPIPALGTVTPLNRPVPAGVDGAFILRKVGRFDAPHPLSQGVSASLPDLGLTSGLAVVLECPPGKLDLRTDFPHADQDFELAVEAARDDHRFPLLRGNLNIPRTFFVAGDALADVGGAAPNAITLYFLPPPPGAKFFRFDLSVTRNRIVRRESTSFGPLSLPPPPAAGTRP